MRKQFIFVLLSLVSIFVYGDNGLWKLRTTDVNGTYVGAPVANGRIGILPWREPFSVRHVILNHVFDADVKNGISKMLRGINPFSMTMLIDGEKIDLNGISGWEQVIDMKEATHNTSFEVANKAKVAYSICALRNMPYSGIINVEVEALNDLHLCMENKMDVPDEYKNVVRSMRPMTSDGLNMKIFRTSALSKYRERKVSASSAFLCQSGPQTILCNDENVLTARLKRGEKIRFSLLGSICSDRDFLDPHGESDRQLTFIAKEGIERTMENHKKAWIQMWEGDIIIEGDDDAQRNVRFALYNLYSYARAGSGLSISPMGLSSQGYNGHIFWDTEIWMYPPMLFLNQGIAKSMVDYRTDRLEAALHRADNYGYKGAMFPWESDDAGQESCPIEALTGAFEHHITADIAIATWNYYCMSGDKEWLRTKGYPLLKNVADFWVSRVQKNNDGSYSILNVVCADEFAIGVDDNAFTNGAAIKALQHACRAAAICGEKAPAVWKEVADNIRIVKMKDGVTSEYDGYDGRIIKQADANLLAYPLGLINNPEEMKKDLEYYLPRIKPNEPAMSHAIFSVQYARLGDGEKAYELFKQSYEPHAQPPFGVITETAASQNPYFATGAGGMLQAVINGFCGLEITDKGIKQLPSTLPKHWKRVIVKGVGIDRKTYMNVQK